MNRKNLIKQIAGEEQSKLQQTISAYYHDYDEEGIDEEGLNLLREVAYKIYDLCEYIASNRI